jgi:hypothetical protein
MNCRTRFVIPSDKTWQPIKTIMKTNVPGRWLAAGIVLLSAAGAASAQQNCDVFPSQEKSSGHERGSDELSLIIGLLGQQPREQHSGRERGEKKYSTCEECLRENDRCEERCEAETGYTCTASGYDQRDYRQTVQGDAADRERRARRNAVQRCRDQGLMDCEVDSCAEESQQAGANRVRPCSDVPDSRRERDADATRRRSGRARHEDEQPVSSLPAGKYVVSWQHVKEQCLGKPYEKIAAQCGGRVNFWHGIRCRVTWSDGSVEELGGKVDLTDPYGRPYCTRDTRPANFNCVSQCDDTPGPLITLPRP